MAYRLDLKLRQRKEEHAMGGSGGGSKNFGRSSEDDGGVLGRGGKRTSSKRGGGGGGVGGGGECSEFSESTFVQSPISSVVSKLENDQILKVRLHEGVVCVFTKADLLVGGILSPKIKLIIDCLKAGHKFEAKILSIDGGAVRIWVRTAE